ncbi:MAG TPA: hypothetical protein VK923_10740 [Euzebyales bacterium]|nr:hypothetical protein [Euzebyales bacterium]
MADTSEAWERVTDRMSALALKLKLHAREELSDEDLRSKVGFDKFRAVVNEAMDGIQTASEDEAVRADARDARDAFVDAIDATVRDVERRLRSRSDES